jgi:hypothetical protein
MTRWASARKGHRSLVRGISACAGLQLVSRGGYGSLQTRKTPTSFRKPGFWVPCFRKNRWLRGHATPDPGEMEAKTGTAPLPELRRWYRKNRWLRGPATNDSCSSSKSKFPKAERDNQCRQLEDHGARFCPNIVKKER